MIAHRCRPTSPRHEAGPLDADDRVAVIARRCRPTSPRHDAGRDGRARERAVLARRALVGLLVVALFAANAFAQGNTQVYRVKQDDTLDVIAAEFYGDRSLGRLIIAENKLKKRLQPGQRLRIPVTRDIVTIKGDTFQSLAQTHLGDAKRAVVLADFNERDVNDVPPVGTLITIPIQITHVAQGTESLASIATQYWNDAKQAEQLRRHNFLDKSTLEKGEAVIVPMIKVRVRKPPALDADSKQRREDQQNAAAEAARGLPSARSAWLAADFDGVKAALEPLVDWVDYLETPQAVEVDLLLAKAYLAFNEPQRAIESFTRIRTRKPTHTLSPYYESPKVIDAWTKAGGKPAQ